MEEADKVAIRLRETDRKIADTESRRRGLKSQLQAVTAEKGTLEKEREKYQELLRAFSDPRRDELTGGGKRKSFRFPCGVIGQWGFPSSYPLVVAGTMESIARALLKLPNYKKYVEIRLKKNSIKADLDELHKVSRVLKRALHLGEKKERFWAKT